MLNAASLSTRAARALAPLPLLLALAGLVASAPGCSTGANSGDGAGWSQAIPTDEPAVVTIENLSYDPPRILGLVSDDHPAADAEDAELRRTGVKRIPADRMVVLLDELTRRGFVDASQPLAEFVPSDPKRVLRRLVVTVGEQRRAFTLPRGPNAATAEQFNALAHAVQAMFNEVVDFRLEGSAKSSLHFYELQQKLFDAGRVRKQAAAGRSP